MKQSCHDNERDEYISNNISFDLAMATDVIIRFPLHTSRVKLIEISSLVSYVSDRADESFLNKHHVLHVAY